MYYFAMYFKGKYEAKNDCDEIKWCSLVNFFGRKFLRMGHFNLIRKRPKNIVSFSLSPRQHLSIFFGFESATQWVLGQRFIYYFQL